MLPNIISYGSLMNACAKCALPELALMVVSAMKQQGMLPDTITYSALISACEKGT